MTAPLPPRFKCPPNMVRHLAEVFSGEYAIELAMVGPPVVLDIGANVGAFARWAALQWKGAGFVCVEPNPKLQSMLAFNLDGLEAGVIAKAVTTTSESTAKLYMGGVNVGEATTLPEAATSTEWVEVPTVHAEKLPACDILKLDCEGNEPGILAAYLGWHGDAPYAIVGEYHTAYDREAILNIAQDYGYARVKVREINAVRGIFGLRKDVPR